MRARAPADVTLLSKVDDEDRIGIDRNTCQHIKRLEQTEQYRSSFGGKLSLFLSGSVLQKPETAHNYLTAHGSFCSAHPLPSTILKGNKPFYSSLSIYTLIAVRPEKQKTSLSQGYAKRLTTRNFRYFSVAILLQIFHASTRTHAPN